MRLIVNDFVRVEGGLAVGFLGCVVDEDLLKDANAFD